MFQSFDDPADTASTVSRLEALREKMRIAGVNWYLVPHADEHQNEYLPERAERLAWLTGFTGSAGFCLVGLEEAWVFVDGRYTVQAARQVDKSAFQTLDLMADPPVKLARDVVGMGDTVGFDPWLITIGQKKSWTKTAETVGAELTATENLIDQIWTDQPAPPTGKAWLHPVRHAGRKVEEKLAEIRQTLADDKATHCLLTDPASLAWLFNIRGSDLIHNPLVLGWALVPVDGKPDLFIDLEKFAPEDRDALSGVAHIRPEEQLLDALACLPNGSALHVDPSLVASALVKPLPDNTTLIEKRDPVALPRAVKNDAELQGARDAHLRDGAAMAKFLCWLDEQTPGTVNEITAAKSLEALRRATATLMKSELREISFDTISGAGANGAIVHYRVTETTNATLENGSLYLVDSGGQYVDGTTDITRTIAIGEPSADAVRDNTLVLKGHIAIATARFPEGTRGVDLDGLARIALWKEGKDYAHGTGHGVGSYLNVHEGPQSISKRGMEPLKPGMIISNEPGFYKEGEYGIRIENLVIVTPPQDGMLSFETITLCPIDTRLIDPALLTADERGWLNTYHARVRDALSVHVNDKVRSWLEAATAPV